MSVSNELLATYELYRLNLLTAWKAGHLEGSSISRAHVFAWSNRMCPAFDHRIDRPDPFEGCYEWSYNDVFGIIKFLDEHWLKGELFSYYDVENKLDLRGVKRVLLIETLRYCNLNGGFDKPFWDKIRSRCPAEAHGLTDPDPTIYV